MSDVGSDLEAVIKIAVSAQQRLLAKNPTHELIAFINIKDDEAANDAWAKLISSFGKYPERIPKGAMERAYAWSKYLIALKLALGERPAPDTQAVTASGMNRKPVYLDDDFPF